jgi:hypothetical protein
MVMEFFAKAALPWRGDTIPAHVQMLKHNYFEKPGNANLG